MCALGILAGAIVWWVCEVLPEYLTALVMAGLFIVVAQVPTDAAFATFSSPTWWLLFAAFALGYAMRKCGLMRRIALGVLRLFPQTFAAQSLGLIAAGTAVGPFIPSLSAKAVIMAPLAMSISDSMGYARKSRQASGIFLAMFTGLRNTGPLFVSASIIGYGLLGLLPADIAAQFDMLHWAIAMLPWFAVVTLLNFAAIVGLYGPRASRRRKFGLSAESDALEGALGASGGVSVASAGSLQTPCGQQAAHLAGTGPMSVQEKRMCVVMCACVVLWVLEPLHHIPAHVVGLAAFVATVALGVVDAGDVRSGVAWDSLIFLGVVLSLASVLAHLGIDAWIVSCCTPLFSELSSNPYMFLAAVGVITVLLRFVIVSDMAFMNLFMVCMVPLSLSLGFSPWVVGITVYAMVDPWFCLYQNPVYMSAYYATDGDMVSHGAMARFCGIYLAICLAGIMVSVPYWQLLGIL